MVNVQFVVVIGVVLVLVLTIKIHITHTLVENAITRLVVCIFLKKTNKI
jgi:hypothetical protein